MRYKLYIVPKIAGTMESKRENSKRSGVSHCSKVLGGMRGLEEGIMRAVGRWRD